MKDFTKFVNIAEEKQKEIANLKTANDEKLKAEKIEMQRLEEEKVKLEEEKVKSIADKVFSELEIDVENAAKRGERSCVIYSVNEKQFYHTGDFKTKVYIAIEKLLDADGVKHKTIYRTVEDLGYGDCYVREDESYADLTVLF
ncbi:MAG: hypothetical protein WC979_03320 [Candidatus Pacearchaeota archaeon]|jgi:membrane protein involved in colicin uptake|nr:hypothetical protein [Clostridia bacterium]